MVVRRSPTHGGAHRNARFRAQWPADQTLTVAIGGRSRRSGGGSCTATGATICTSAGSPKTAGGGASKRGSPTAGGGIRGCSAHPAPPPWQLAASGRSPCWSSSGGSRRPITSRFASSPVTKTTVTIPRCRRAIRPMRCITLHCRSAHLPLTTADRPDPVKNPLPESRIDATRSSDRLTSESTPLLPRLSLPAFYLPLPRYTARNARRHASDRRHHCH